MMRMKRTSIPILFQSTEENKKHTYNVKIPFDLVEWYFFL